MKLRSLAVNQFKKFTTPVKLEGMTDGLNVFVGPNEMGKSTLLDALRAVLSEKHNSKSQSIRKLQNERSEAAPVVELEFELQNGIHRVRKRFLKKPYARLHLPDGTTLEGDTAERTLRDLLNFSESAKGSSAETLGMWHVLWVKQGQSFSAPDISTTAKTSLQSALESEVGTVLGGKQGWGLPRIIEKQLDELVTSTGRSRGEYKTTEQHVDSLRGELEDLKEKKKSLSEDLKNLEDFQEKQKRLSDPARDKTDRAELDSLRMRRGELLELENSLDGARRELEVRGLRFEQAERNERERRELKDNIARKKNELSEHRKKHEELRERETETLANLEKLKTEKNNAETASREADEILSRKSRILGAVEVKTRISELEVRLGKALDAEKRRSEARNRAAVIAVTEEMIKRAEAAEEEKEKSVNRLNASSTLIAFDMENPSGIKLNDSPLESVGDSLQAVSPVTITIPERGKIMIEPATENRDKLLKCHEEAKKQLKYVLREAGVSSIEEARNLYNELQKALEEADFARKEAELYAPGTDGYKAGAQALSDQVKELEDILESGMEKLPDSDLPPLREAETALHKALDESEAARHVLEEARAALVAPEAIVMNFRRELDNIEVLKKEAEKDIENLLGRLKGAEEEFSDDKLKEDCEAARKAISDQEDEIAKLLAKRGEDDALEQIELRIERFEKSAEEKHEKHQKLQENIISLKARIDVLEGAGLDEDIHKTERELHLREEERKRYEHETQVLDLLLRTLRDAERKAKELYLSPVTDRMGPYLQHLFPGSRITIDEDLHITGVIREAGYEEPFPLLSMGTQEQIAVLVRLAFAEMLIEQGQPAAVVLDDALAFSDDRRIEQMFNILSFASRKVQILVLTCREQLFENSGGNLLSLEPGDPEELISA